MRRAILTGCIPAEAREVRGGWISKDSVPFCRGSNSRTSVLRPAPCSRAASASTDKVAREVGPLVKAGLIDATDAYKRHLDDGVDVYGHGGDGPGVHAIALWRTDGFGFFWMSNKDPLIEDFDDLPVIQGWPSHDLWESVGIAPGPVGSAPAASNARPCGPKVGLPIACEATAPAPARNCSRANC